MARPEISERLLVGIFGSQSACRVLLYLENYNKGYASEIARTFGMSLNQAQSQLKKFEQAGVLVSRDEGNTRMYYIKQSPVADALRRFLRETLDTLPTPSTEKYFRQRRRPRRFGKR